MRTRKFKGLYDSYVRFNFGSKHNDRLAQWFRENFHIYDNNQFVSTFVLFSILESYEYGMLDLDTDSVDSTVISLTDNFIDKNQPNPGTPAYTFWP